MTAFSMDFGSFPFVVVPQISLERMRLERPSLLLAMLVTATRKDFVLQEALDKEFKIQILTQVTIDGVRSLELIQGLLVYLSWYHLRFK